MAALAKPLLIAEIQRLLDAADWDAIAALRGSHASVVRLLIGMTYDKGALRGWRAMEAIGRLSAHMSPGEGRALIQRLLWMMREESGTNPWSAVEIVAEILRANPEPYPDIVPIAIGMHDEPILRKGSLWTIIRLAEAHPGLVAPFEHVPLLYASSTDPLERGLAVLALAALGKAGHPAIRRLSDDPEEFTYYDGQTLVRVSIAHVLRQASVTAS